MKRVVDIGDLGDPELAGSSPHVQSGASDLGWPDATGTPPRWPWLAGAAAIAAMVCAAGWLFGRSRGEPRW